MAAALFLLAALSLAPCVGLAASAPSPGSLPPAAPAEAPEGEIDPDVIFEQATAAVEAGQFDMAARLFETVVRTDPTNAQAYYKLAQVWEALDNAEQALVIYRRLRNAHPGARWHRLAMSRIAVLAYRVALGRLATAESLAARGGFREGMTALRLNQLLEVAPSLQQYMRATYYDLLARELGSIVAAQMTKEETVTLGVARFDAADTAWRSSAAALSQRLVENLKTQVDGDVIPLAASSGMVHVAMTEAEARESGRLAQELTEAGGVDLILTAAVGSTLRLQLFDPTHARLLWSAEYPLPAGVPPLLTADAWRRLTRDYRPVRGFRAAVWTEGTGTAAGEGVQLKCLAGQSSYVTVLEFYADGSARILLPTDSQGEEFVFEDELRILPPAANPPAGVVGEVLIASHAPLVLPARMYDATLPPDQAVALAAAVKASLAATSPATWAMATWTWQPGEAPPAP